jgi:hypothetical protein
MRTRILGLAALIGVALQATPASAGCTWHWDCSAGAGQCRQIPLCDSSIDLPPIQPIGIPPIPPPTIKPIPQPMVPPIGTTQYGPRYLCDGGACQWRTVCL